MACPEFRAFLALGTTLALLGGCGDDGGDDPIDAHTTTSAGSGSTDDNPPSGVSDATGNDNTSSGDSTGPDATTTSGADDDSSDGSSGTTGGALPGVTLVNDGWAPGETANFMGGFVATECWASTFVPEPDDYPFEVDSTRMIVGGEKRTRDQMFTVGLWTVDKNNMPQTELSSATVVLTGQPADIDVVNFPIAGIESPVFTEGNFALVGCLAKHDNLPAIAADVDGQIDHPDRNWIRIESGEWMQSTAFGVGGDWIMRAVILPPLE